MNVIISVIIPFYNREKFAESLAIHIRSINQAEIEFIIVDDCSTDFGFSVIKDQLKDTPNIKFLQQDKNRGAPYARQLGFLHSTGVYVAFLDSDDEFSQRRIKVDLAVIADKSPDAIIHRHVYQTYDGLFRRARLIGPDALYQLWWNSWHTSGITYSRDFLRLVLGWTNHMPAEDNVLHAKVKLFAKNVIIFNSCGAICRQGVFNTLKLGRGSEILRAFDQISKLERAGRRVRSSKESSFSVLRKYFFWFRSGAKVGDLRYFVYLLTRRTIFKWRKFYELLVYEHSNYLFGSEQSFTHLENANTSPLLGFSNTKLTKSFCRLDRAISSLLSALVLRLRAEVDIVVANQVGYAPRLKVVFPNKRVQTWVRICDPGTVNSLRTKENNYLPPIYNSPLCASTCGRPGIVIENPIPYSATPIQRSRDTVIAYFGRLEEEKGIIELVESVVRAPYVRLFVFGSGSLSDLLNRNKFESKLEGYERITFIAPIPNAVELMPLFDAVIMPSKLEPWGRVAYEVLGSGVFLICTKNLGCWDNISHHPKTIPIDSCTVENLLPAFELVSVKIRGLDQQEYDNEIVKFSSRTPEEIAMAIKSSINLWPGVCDLENHK